MQVSVEKTSELKRRMTVSLPEEVILERMESRFQSLARDVKMDGFRPGKVPKHVVKKMYGARVRGEVTGDLIQSSYFDALQDQGLKPASPPHIVPEDTEKEGKGFQYIAEFEVYPEVSLDGLEQIEVERPVAQVQESDIDAMQEKLRDQQKQWEAVTRPAQKEDRITINFSGVVEGENFTDGTTEDFQVVIGSEEMIPGFEDNLIGLEVDAEKTFVVTFPEEYGNEKIAGKEAEFTVVASKIEEPVLPELDADFFKIYGVEAGDLAAFRETLKQNMESELAEALRGKLKNAVMDGLHEKIQLTLPEALIDQEIEALMKPYQERAKQQNKQIEDLNLGKDLFENQAKRRVALGFILAEIIQQQDIKVDGSRVRATIEGMAKSYEHPEEVVNWHYAEEGRLRDVEQKVLEEQTVDWLLENIKTTDVETTFDEIMSQGQ
jgi:trigger factor